MRLSRDRISRAVRVEPVGRGPHLTPHLLVPLFPSLNQRRIFDLSPGVVGQVRKTLNREPRVNKKRVAQDENRALGDATVVPAFEAPQWVAQTIKLP